MKAPITQAQAWAVIAESAGWNAKELPVLPDLTLMWADINAWHESKTPYPKPTAAINETVIAMLQAYGAACAAHAREMAISETVSIAYGYADNLTWNDSFKAEIKALKGK